MWERSPGFEEYTPSRLEWLTVLLNSLIQYANSIPGEDIQYAYLPATDGKTIIMRIRYRADMDPKLVKNLEDGGKEFTKGIAKIYNWDSWINIQTELDPVDRPTKEKD